MDAENTLYSRPFAVVIWSSLAGTRYLAAFPGGQSWPRHNPGYLPKGNNDLSVGGAGADELDLGRGLGEYPLIFVNQSSHFFPKLENIFVGRNRELEIDPPCPQRGMIDDLIAHDLRVWYGDKFVVWARNLGGKDFNISNEADRAARLDIIPNSNWPKKNEQCPGRKIRERSLQSETNGQTGGTEYCDQRSGLYSKLVQR
jgi:hypothetical protein